MNGYNSTQDKRQKQIHLGQAINIVTKEYNAIYINEKKDKVLEEIGIVFDLIEEANELYIDGKKKLGSLEELK